MAYNIRILLCTLACIFSVTANADWASDREATLKQNRIEYAEKVYGMSNTEATKKVNAGYSNGKVTQSSSFEGTSSDGSKIRAGAKVTQTANKAKVAEALAERFKNAGKYAKNLGKASLPSFVGVAAFHGLMNGVDYVMDPENNTIQKPNPALDQNTSVQPYHEYRYYDAKNNSWNASAVYLCKRDVNASDFNLTYLRVSYESETKVRCWSTKISDGSTYEYSPIQRQKNPSYNSTVTNPIPARVDATDAEVASALKKALESNNAALASAIAEAIKAAYTPDTSPGQSLVDIPSNGTAMDAFDSARDAVRKAGNSTGEEPTSDGKPGYYKITDGDKTIEGYVTPADTSAQTSTGSESTTVTDPITGNQTTTGTSSGSLQFPAFCDWAGIVCSWIDWTKEEPEKPEDLPVLEEINVPFFPFTVANFNASCPPDQQLSMNLMGQEQTFVLPMSPFCDFFSALKPFVIAMASFFAVKLIGNGAFNSGN